MLDIRSVVTYKFAQGHNKGICHTVMQIFQLNWLIYIYGSTATNVEIEVPVPSDAMSPHIRTSMGYATYAPERDAVVWKIKSFPGNKVVLNKIYVCNVSI